MARSEPGYGETKVQLFCCFRERAWEIDLYTCLLTKASLSKTSKRLSRLAITIAPRWIGPELMQGNKQAIALGNCKGATCSLKVLLYALFECWCAQRNHAGLPRVVACCYCIRCLSVCCLIQCSNSSHENWLCKILSDLRSKLADCYYMNGIIYLLIFMPLFFHTDRKTLFSNVPTLVSSHYH